MRSYYEYCAVAKALDVIGDRWTLLIVRELLLRERCRYTDLRHGLPGIATNLLAQRLRELESAGIVRREEAPPPIATTLFSLTPRGRELEPVVHELGRWGVPYMVDGLARRDAFRGHWLAWPVELFLHDRDPEGAPLQIGLEVDGEPLVLDASGGTIEVAPGTAEHPDASIAGSPYAVLGVLSGRSRIEDASRLGVRVDGDAEAIRRLVPARASDSPQRD